MSPHPERAAGTGERSSYKTTVMERQSGNTERNIQSCSKHLKSSCWAAPNKLDFLRLYSYLAMCLGANQVINPIW